MCESSRYKNQLMGCLLWLCCVTHVNWLAQLVCLRYIYTTLRKYVIDTSASVELEHWLCRYSNIIVIIMDFEVVLWLDSG